MQQKFLARLLSLALCAVLPLGLTACSKADDTEDLTAEEIAARDEVASVELQFTEPESGDTIAVFHTSLGDISAVLYTELAPQACENFITLAQEGFYDGSAIDRIVGDFCVQAGRDASGQASTIWSGSSYPIEATDTLHHYAGALCTATDSSGEASSPFYFVSATADAVNDAMVSAMQEASYRDEVITAYQEAGGVPYLDYTDTVFGQIYDGMEVLDAIAALETDENDAPLEAFAIDSVTITTY